MYFYIYLYFFYLVIYLDIFLQGPICPQPSPSRNSSEDCLSLNIYVPINASANAMLPVYIFIHGGYIVLSSMFLFAPLFDINTLVRSGVAMVVMWMANTFLAATSSLFPSITGIPLKFIYLFFDYNVMNTFLFISTLS